MEWHPVIRELHLSGGRRAFNGMDPKVLISPQTLNDKQIVVTLKGFGSLYREISSLNLTIIGCDFFTSPEEVENYDPPQWRTHCKANKTWLCTDQGHEWSFICNSAFQAKNGILCDIASRLSHQIRACEWRLRQLSECYASQLRSSQRKHHDDGTRFKDGHTSLCYLALQSFLVDACILRDYLAEFYWEAINRAKLQSTQRVTTLGGLLKIWKKNPPDDAAGKEFFASAKSGQWLFELGAYRDLVVHTAPLAQAGKSLFAVTKNLDLPNGEILPGITLPLPSNPTGLTNDRASGKYFEDPNLNFARLLNTLEDINDCRDALEYAHLSMQLLSAMSQSITKISPLKPEIPIITPIPGTFKIIEQ